MATGTLVSVTVLPSGTQVDVLWSIAATTWGVLSIQPGKTASITVFGVVYPLTSVVSQTDPGGEGALALVRLGVGASPIPAGTAYFNADARFLVDPTSNFTPGASNASATNGVPVGLRFRERNARSRRSLGFW